MSTIEVEAVVEVQNTTPQESIMSDESVTDVISDIKTGAHYRHRVMSSIEDDSVNENTLNHDDSDDFPPLSFPSTELPRTSDVLPLTTRARRRVRHSA